MVNAAVSRGQAVRVHVEHTHHHLAVWLRMSGAIPLLHPLCPNDMLRGNFPLRTDIQKMNWGS